MAFTEPDDYYEDYENDHMTTDEWRAVESEEAAERREESENGPFDPSTF